MALTLEVLNLEVNYLGNVDGNALRATPGRVALLADLTQSPDRLRDLDILLIVVRAHVRRRVRAALPVPQIVVLVGGHDSPWLGNDEP